MCAPQRYNEVHLAQPARGSGQDLCAGLGLWGYFLRATFRGPGSVTLKKGEFLSASGGCTWTKQ